MIDYFALLEQPRQPWLDVDELKRRYQTLARTEHPDQNHAGRGTTDFASVNEAYRCLKDPKLRLHHLLALEGELPSSAEIVPPDLVDLFSRISHFIQKADQFLARWRATQNSLAKSLLQAELLTIQRDGQAMSGELKGLYEQATKAMPSANDWRSEIENLKKLYLRFAYLGRWVEQVEERNFSLSTLS